MFVTRKFVGDVVRPLQIYTQPKSVEIPGTTIVISPCPNWCDTGSTVAQVSPGWIKVLIIDSEKVWVRIEHEGFPLANL